MNRTLLLDGATHWTQSLVNHQIGYLKPGLSLTADPQGLFDLEKFSKERVASLVRDCGKWNKKTDDLRSDWWIDEWGQNWGKESLCEEKCCFWKRWNTSVHHLIKLTCVLKYSTLAQAHKLFSLSLSVQAFEILFHIKSATQECLRVHTHVKKASILHSACVHFFVLFF